MCGICGIIGTPKWDRTAALENMLSAMHHRGPDGEGVHQDRQVILGMTRLSIIDLAHGQQPLYSEDKSVAVIANGEIYNYKELQEELRRKGHHFATNSDCETIVHLYEQYGLDFVDHLRGMFAIALWDKARNRMVLARDRMGEKPLYLFEHQGTIVFASELKVLLASGAVPFELDPAAIDQYFLFHYVPEPGTPLRGVRKLDAGHMLVVDLAPRNVREITYWRMADAPVIDGDPVEAVRGALEDIARIVVRSDVPVGVALSGGLDSSAIATLAARTYPGTLQALSVGYPGRPPFDERAEAKELADHIGIPLHEVEINPSEVVEGFTDLIRATDDPIADISGTGYRALMNAARDKGIPVMLQGQGGDELFWGYPWLLDAIAMSERKAALDENPWGALHSYVTLRRPTGRHPRALAAWLASLGGIRENVSQWRHDRSLPEEQLVFYQAAPTYQAAPNGGRDLFTPRFLDAILGERPLAQFRRREGESIPMAITRSVCDVYLRENGVAQGDRLSMSASVELRLPLLDYRLVETVIGLRRARPDHKEGPKAWLRQALESVVPNFVMTRKKRGFSPPVQEWHKALFARYGDTLLEGELVQADVLHEKAAAELATGTSTPGAGVPMPYKALVLETWCREMKKVTNSV